MGHVCVGHQAHCSQLDDRARSGGGIRGDFFCFSSCLLQEVHEKKTYKEGRFEKIPLNVYKTLCRMFFLLLFQVCS